MKIKNKIQSKICELEQEVEHMEQEVKTIVNSEWCDWSRVTILVNGMNIIANQIEILRGLY